jgi:F-type H+-transporting ATPase subunit a
MFTLPLALITFIGIYVVGIGTMGFIHFCKHKYSNPLEIIGQFLPLLSMSIRLFAATLAGAIIGNVT